MKTALSNIKIPDSLVREVIDGKPFYYKGYQMVLAKKKNSEDIRGSSSLQAKLISLLLRYLFGNLDFKKYDILTNEAGLHLEKNDNVAGDIMIFDRALLTPEKFSVHYTDVPPKVAIEVDIEVDTTDLGETHYIFSKTQKLLSLGVEKVIWIFTNSKKIMIASHEDEEWHTMNWNKDLILFDEYKVNIQRFFDEEGIVI